MIHRLSSACVLAVLVAGASPVAAKQLDAEMQSYVIASCSSDAYRLCPASLSSQDAAVSCMKTKRAQLGQVCRVAYDKVVRTLAQ